MHCKPSNNSVLPATQYLHDCEQSLRKTKFAEQRFSKLLLEEDDMKIPCISIMHYNLGFQIELSAKICSKTRDKIAFRRFSTPTACPI